jgi:cysteine desulfurase
MLKSNNKLNKKARLIYLDHASSSLISSPNSGAVHELGIKEKNKLENARKKIASTLKVQNSEIIFTGGATESNNLAILGTRVGHIITTNIEHASVLESAKHRGNVTFVSVESDGIVDPKKIKKAIKKNTVLVSVMYANNEIGTIQPIKEIAKEIRHFNKINKSNIVFHTDATQAVNYLPVGIPQLGIDMMSFNAAKIYGPKGVGVLYVKKNTPIKKIIFGGDQEYGLRPGTENVAGAVALASALERTEKIKEKEVKRLTMLRDYFINKLQEIKSVKLNGDLKNRLPNNINITVPNIPSDLLVIELSTKGIMSSVKSACKSGDGKASHVISAIDKNTKETDGSVRFSLGRDTTKADIDFTLKALSKILLKLTKWYN